MPEFAVKGAPAVLFAFISAMALTWYFIPRIIRIVNERNLSDKPGRHKIHKKSIPTLGGIGIFAGFIFGFLMGVNNFIPGATYVTASATVLFFVGVMDDLLYLNPKNKLIAEVFSILIIMFFTNLRFTSLQGFLGISTIPGLASYLITIFIMVLIINAFNLIDGIDGLAASIGIIASLTFGVWFWFSGEYGYTIMAAALIGSLIIFMKHNISDGPDKIFMGDSGSLVIGFILAVFVVHFNEINHTERTFHNLHSAPSVSIAILIIPLFDTLRVIILRLLDHQNPFKADNRHIHHLLLRAGFSHKRASLIISAFNVFIIIIGLLLDGIGIMYLGLLLLILCFAFVEGIRYIVRRYERGVKE